jgi:hypothetical protein
MLVNLYTVRQLTELISQVQTYSYISVAEFFLILPIFQCHYMKEPLLLEYMLTGLNSGLCAC